MKDRYLTNRDYVRIKNFNTVSYGGNQKWCKSSSMQKKGCGVIAMADLAIYLAEQNPRMMTEDIMSISKPNGLYNKNDYLEYIRKFYHKYVTIPTGNGLTGFGMMCAMNRYFMSCGLRLKASWKLMLSDESMMMHIVRQLERNIPVIISIGPNTPNIWGKTGISFYVEQDGSLIESRRKDVKSHYVTVTGVRTIDRRQYLVISSWGREYLMDYDEYREYVLKTGGRITSSMLLIKARS